MIIPDEIIRKSMEYQKKLLVIKQLIYQDYTPAFATVIINL